MANQPARTDQASRPVVAAFQSSSYFSGPLPPPEILLQYNDVVPDGANRLFLQFEQQARHRQELEQLTVKGDSSRSWIGLILGFVLSMTCIVGGCILVYFGHDAAGGTIATGSVAALAGVFAYGSSIRKEERLQKAQILTGPKSKK